MRLKPILLAGPTASGKSGLAIELAERLGGVVVNADSQQVFEGWQILTARPTNDDHARVPHLLYGHVPMGVSYSVGAWLRDLVGVLARLEDEGRVPIITGGTGLYFKGLTEGLAEIPPVPADVRAAAEARLEQLGLAGFAAELATRDPDTVAALDQANPVRVLRAWEVLEATGKGLAQWRAETPPPLVPLAEAHALHLSPDRDTLYTQCDARLDAMLAEGVLEEVASVRSLGLNPDLPAMKALGAPEFLAHLSGEITLDAALEAAKHATRRYAKRQLTWARNQMPDWTALPAPDAEAVLRLEA